MLRVTVLQEIQLRCHKGRAASMGGTFLGGVRRAGEARERLEGDGVHGVHAAAVDLDAGVQRHAGALEVGQLAGAPGRLRPHGQLQADTLTTAAIHTEEPNISW